MGEFMKTNFINKRVTLIVLFCIAILAAFIAFSIPTGFVKADSSGSL